MDMSSQVWRMAVGSCVPSSTNTMPFSAKATTRHTLDDTMFMRAMEGPMARGDMTFMSPATTTAMMPLTWKAWAAKYTMSGVNTSNSTWNVVFSTPMSRALRTIQLAARPNAAPNSSPPTNSTRKFTEASMRLKVPVMQAASANWNDTMPDASLSSSSPLSRLFCRSGMSICFDSEDTATASVGPSAAPRAKAAASGMEGMTACTENPMMSVVATTSPMASDRMGLRSRQSLALSAFLASSNSSGAMNSTRNISGSSSMCTALPAPTAMMMPMTIWTSGSDMRGTSWSMMDDSSTAASSSKASVMVSTDSDAFRIYKRASP